MKVCVERGERGLGGDPSALLKEISHVLLGEVETEAQDSSATIKIS
jgi:hypothetical protein